jgi:GNAT superfamily N-acetyltransferase
MQARDESSGAVIEGTGQLRLLLVEPSARGRGLGAQLTAECERFAAACGYHKLKLWTQRELTAARAVYAKRGWQLLASAPHESFGKAVVAEVWELALPS